MIYRIKWYNKQFKVRKSSFMATENMRVVDTSADFTWALGKTYTAVKRLLTVEASNEADTVSIVCTGGGIVVSSKIVLTEPVLLFENL